MAIEFPDSYDGCIASFCDPKLFQKKFAFNDGQAVYQKGVGEFTWNPDRSRRTAGNQGFYR